MTTTIGPLDEVLAAFDAQNEPAGPCHPGSIDWDEFASDRKRIEAEWQTDYDAHFAALNEEASAMIETRPSDRPFDEGILPDGPTEVRCVPLPHGPSATDDDHEDGYSLGRDGELLDLAGRSGAFVTGYYAGQQDAAEAAIASRYDAAMAG